MYFSSTPFPLFAASRCHRFALSVAIIGVLLLSLPTPALAQENCQIAVMTMRSLGLSKENAHVPEVITDTIADVMAEREDCQIVTQADIAQMMDFEAMKATCAVDSPSCIAEIGGALGVSRVVNGSVASLGSSFKLQVKLHNVSTGIVEKRFNRLVSGDAVEVDKTAREAAKILLSVIPSSHDSAADGKGEQIAAAQAAETEQGQNSTPAAGSTTPSQENEPEDTSPAEPAPPPSKEDSATAAVGETPSGESSSGDGSSAATEAEAEGFALGTGVMVAGGVILVGSALALVGGGATAGGLELAINASVITGNDRHTARYAGIAGLGLAAVGVVGVMVGAGVGAASFLLE